MSSTTTISERGTALRLPLRSRLTDLRLFCFPYAGGGATTFRTWPRSLPENVEICPVHLPGRGARSFERPFSDLRQLVRSLADDMAPYLGQPFAFFGHSMGAMVSFELARYLRRTRGLGPTHLFVSGCRAPQVKNTEAPTHDLPEPEFIDELKRINGTPPEVFEHAELLQMMLPLLRADFSVCQTYSYLPEPPLSCPVTAFGGIQDRDVTRAQLEGWGQQTTGKFTMSLLPGDHFFINTAQRQLLNKLAQSL
jgi:medium-chain acyl-[acyl-carrier-protein] hydrolase